jgi:hypothetical protein
MNVIMIDTEVHENSISEQDKSISEQEKSIEQEASSEFINKCESLIKEINETSKKHKDEIRELIKLHKKEIKNIQKHKPTKKQKEKKGFTKPSKVPDKIADFIGVSRGSLMARTKVSSLLMDEFKKRNLLYSKDKRIIIPDYDTKQLFPNLKITSEVSTNPKDPNGLNVYTLQRHLTDCYNIDKAKTMNKKI